MSGANYYVENMILQCEKILAGDYANNEQEHIDGFMLALEGYARGARRNDLLAITQDKSRNGIMRAKGFLIGNMARASAGVITSVVNKNQSHAEATISISIAEAIGQVKASELSAADKDALELALSRMRLAAEAKDEKSFADKLKDALDVAAKVAGLIPVVIGAAGSLSSFL